MNYRSKQKFWNSSRNKCWSGEQKRTHLSKNIMYSIGVYLLFFAVYFIGHFYFEIWNASVILAELLIATAIVVFVWVKSSTNKS